MGDRVYASIEIGGRLESIKEAEELIDALIHDGLADDKDNATAALRRHIEEMTAISAGADQVKFGTFQAVEHAVKSAPGLKCVTKYNAANDFPEGWTFANQTEVIEIPTCGGRPCLEYSALKSISAISERAILHVVLERMAEIDLAETIPPLTAPPAVAAWLKIFGEKAA